VRKPRFKRRHPRRRGRTEELTINMLNLQLPQAAKTNPDAGEKSDTSTENSGIIVENLDTSTENSGTVSANPGTVAAPTDFPVQVVPVDQIRVGARRRKVLGDIPGLAASIARLGLLHALVVTPDLRLVAGLRRFEAVKKLGWDNVPVHVVHGLDDALKLLRAERDENTCRKKLTLEEDLALARDLEELERAKARERQAEAGPAEGRGKKETASGNFPEAVNGRVRDKIGEVVGRSGRTIEKARAVVEAAANDPDTFGPIKEEMFQTGRVDPAFKKMTVQKSLGQVDVSEVNVGRAAVNDIIRLFRTTQEEIVGFKNRYGAPKDVIAPMGVDTVYRLLNSLEPVLDHFMDWHRELNAHFDKACGECSAPPPTLHQDNKS
jgi:hypothetical protein